MTLTVSACTQWLVTNGWQKVDADDRWVCEPGEIIYTPPKHERYWVHCEHSSGRFISVTPAHEVLSEFPDSAYNDSHITFRFSHAGELEDVAFADTASGDQHIFAYTDAVNGLKPKDMPLLMQGLRSAYSELLWCLDKDVEFTQERLEDALKFDLHLFAIFDVPDKEDAG